MSYRFAMILVVAALPSASFAQQLIVAGDTAGSDRAAVTSKTKPMSASQRRYLKSGKTGSAHGNVAQADPASKAAPDGAHGGTTGASGGVASSPEVHKLNTVLPP
jgi:hypothetical protein